MADHATRHEFLVGRGEAGRRRCRAARRSACRLLGRLPHAQRCAAGQYPAACRLVVCEGSSVGDAGGLTSCGNSAGVKRE